jgi:N-acetylglucosamine kinase-like BadF-type ATPase
MGFVLGVDGGNTKTIALVAQLDGTLAGAARAGCGDIYGAGSAASALGEIERAVLAALAQAGAQPADLAAGVFSLAGADWPEDFALLEREMLARGLGARVLVVNDAIGALRAGSPDGLGVSVVCGTGTAIGARAPGGRVWHTSFWQEPQGAGELAYRALRAVYRADLGIDGPTALTEHVLAFFGERSVEKVLHRLTARERRETADVRLLARALLDTADAGDPTARGIVTQHGASLGDYALTAARQVGLLEQPFRLVLAGGVLRHPSPLLREALVERVRSSAPQALPVRSALEPAAGALMLALEAAGVPATAALDERLAAGLPPPAFFETSG